MRIDKYLWSIRLYKTRSIATEACNKGQISVLDKKVKPSKTIGKGDFIKVRKDQIHYLIKVLDVPTTRVGAKLVDLYKKDETPQEELDKLALIKSSADYYRIKGEGRPTKKDRRDIDDFFEENN
jgi:ribosome-associated heat shock protein Hsp15